MDEGDVAPFDPDTAFDLISLIVLPFLHEDVAVAVGAYMVSNGILSLSLVAIALYGGIVVSDLALFGLGVVARKSRWFEHLADSKTFAGLPSVLKRNVFWLVAGCRLVPGTMFVTFVACGMTGVSLRRFMSASLAISAIYLALLLSLTFAFGHSAKSLIGFWAWPALIAVLLVLELARRNLLNANTVRGFVPAAAGALEAVPSPLDGAARVAAAERIPPLMFYAPLAARWLWLGLRYGHLTIPACANPNILTGGMWGEAKSQYLLQVGDACGCYVAPFALVTVSDHRSIDDIMSCAHNAASAAGIRFPLIAKPDIGWHGFGVRRIAGFTELRAYLEKFPSEARLLLQELVRYQGEAAVLYARLPGEPNGKIQSLTYRYFPYVVGDGVSDLQTLINRNSRARWKARLHLGLDCTHSGFEKARLLRVPDYNEVVQLAFVANQRAGGVYRDATALVTPALEARFDAIAQSMPEFYYGRFDIRFDTTASLMAGERFSIVEINGIGGEAIDVWDPTLTIGEVYRRLFRQQSLLFKIATRNRDRGFKPPTCAEFLSPAFAQARLIKRYPQSE